MAKTAVQAANDAMVLLREDRGPVALLTLNRPDARNSLSEELLAAITAALRDIGDSDAVRAIVLTGAGSAFSSGHDLKELTAHRNDPDRGRAFFAKTLAACSDMMLTIMRSPKPVIAAVNGHCLAGGLEMLLGTDIRIASDQALFGLPEAKRGVIPFAGALVRLPRQIPYAHAMQMMLSGQPMDAPTALRVGLVNELVPAVEVLPRALELAAEVATNAPVSLSEIKRSVLLSSGKPMEEGFAIETQSRDRVMATEDAREGPRAFIERRAPVYKGR
jgi:enoyl-CoA hydratase